MTKMLHVRHTCFLFFFFSFLIFRSLPCLQLRMSRLLTRCLVQFLFVTTSKTIAASVVLLKAKTTK
ncbi:hypothetical protein F9C07_2170201 [Aspergillus flavus]|uniref:Uncharacterized protein n=1 Tax=Aspergillus flavus (strain ATCC 200026 / FGSC A1120 / IAM 13836 / NRRL 3357 / JCM 12722 / SRRC 167) TaxID=332952 RepID=A0A7U2R326_ASPFN|nr:hypothetical protein F9C07_2170201 [Aspergillus flavus]